MSVDLLAPPPPAPITDVTRRDLLRGVGALGAGWVVAGCAPNSDDPAGSGQTRSITHEFGTTEVPATPERIVVVDHAPTLGNLLALGLTPVAAGSYAPTGPQPFHPVLDPLVDGVQPIPAYFAELPLRRTAGALRAARRGDRGPPDRRGPPPGRHHRQCGEDVRRRACRVPGPRVVPGLGDG